MNHIDWSCAWNGRLEQAPRQASADGAARRLEKDLSVGLLPFLHMSYRAKLEADIKTIEPVFKKFKHMVVLGIGGSALGARALQKAFFPQQDRPEHGGRYLWIADNIDADTLEAWFATLNPKETLFVAISKSGGTIETVSQYFLAKEWLKSSLGDMWKGHMILVTDPAKGFFREEVNENGFMSLEVPDNLGGRYSVLSAVGILPAAFLGMNWRDLLDGAASVAAPLVNNPAGIGSHPAWQLAHWGKSLLDNGYSQLIFFGYIPLWSFFGAWFCQLWAESLGKGGKGSMPLPAVGVTDQHSLQQMFLDGPKDKGCIFLTCPSLPVGRDFPAALPEKWQWLKGKKFGDLLHAEALGTAMALTQFTVPTVHLRIGETTEYSAGALMALLMASTVFAGWMLDLDPLDQPAVELGKQLANARLGAPGYDKEAALLKTFMAGQNFADTF
jgi:glucose-6-phosphate isomerase